MKKLLRRTTKNALLALLPDSDRLRILAYAPMFRTWQRAQRGRHPVFRTRFDMYDWLNREIIANQPIDYLEFGVYKGETINFFAKLNTNPKSRFVGFDTFTGLPEAWVEFSRITHSGGFDTGGQPPRSNDARISFVKGLFQEALPGFLQGFKSAGHLLIHNDSDLYSSTLFVLTSMNEYIPAGSIVVFDEFYSVFHEFRALDDYCAAYRRRYSVLGATEGYLQVAIRIE